MKLDIKINEYVRTNEGYIAKLINYDSIIMYATFNKPIYTHGYTPSTMIFLPDLYNREPEHSEDILDLLKDEDILTIELLYTPKEGTPKIRKIIIGEIMSLEIVKQCVKDKLFIIKDINTKERLKSIQLNMKELL